MKRWPYAVLALTALIGCTEQRMTQPSVGRPLALILDGAHNGDPNFFFLPPLVPNPVNDPHFNPSAFDGTLSPTVEVCRLTGDPRVTQATPVFCDAHASLVFGPVPAALDATNQQYQINWDTKAPPGLDATQFYRIRVRGAAGKSVLGSIDVDPVDQGMKNLKTGDVVQFQDGRTLPIKFRIQQGEQCTFNPDCVMQTVGSGGATIVTSEAGGGVTGGGVLILPGALNAGEEITVTISKLLNTPCLPKFDLAQFEGCYRFTANPPLSTRPNGGFNPVTPFPAVVAICVELPVGITTTQEGLLQLHALDANGSVRALPNASAAFLPCEPHRFPPPIGARPGWGGILDRLAAVALPTPAYASMVHLGIGGGTCCFSDVTWGLPVEDAAIPGGDGQTAVSGTAVPTLPSVIVTDANNAPVAGATVHFRIASTGGGSVTPTQVVTGTNGVASVTSWVLAEGTNRLEAFASGIGPAPTFPITSGFLTEGVVPFTANGVTISTTVTDPVGDAGEGNPDLLTGVATAGNGNLALSVRFAPGTFNPATTHALFNLDIDGNPATGFQGIDNGAHDVGVLGVEYLVFLGSASEAGNATILHFNGVGFTTVGTVPVTFSPDGMDVVIPLALLGNDDGQMTFRVEVQTQLTPTPSYTPALDWMPDTTLPPGSLQLPPPPIP